MALYAELLQRCRDSEPFPHWPHLSRLPQNVGQLNIADDPCPVPVGESRIDGALAIHELDCRADSSEGLNCTGSHPEDRIRLKRDPNALRLVQPNAASLPQALERELVASTSSAAPKGGSLTAPSCGT